MRYAIVVGLFFVFGLRSACGGITVGSLTLERESQPGDVYSGSITLTNNGNVAQDVAVYQTDYLFYSDGSNQFGDPGTTARSNARWITFSPRSLQIPPHNSSQISYRVIVPQDTTLIGTYWSMIMIEEVPLASDTAIYLAKNQAGIRQVTRYGAQCITQIGQSGTRQIKFARSGLVENEEKKIELQVDVQNTGERWIVPSAWVELYDGEGKLAGRIDGERKRVFPGTSVRLRFGLDGLTHGKYKALVVLDNGDQNVFGAKYDLEY
jgi:hypothetical protein